MPQNAMATLQPAFHDKELNIMDIERQMPLFWSRNAAMSHTVLSKVQERAEGSRNSP